MSFILLSDVFKPALGHVGRLGAVLITYMASAMLHVRKSLDQYLIASLFCLSSAVCNFLFLTPAIFGQDV